MNNYININLVSGKITRARGGGRPIFTLNESNASQFYILDYARPSTYTSTELGDAFAQTISPVNKDANTLTINIGERIDSAIISNSSWSNLNDSVVSNQSVTFGTSFVDTDYAGSINNTIFTYTITTTTYDAIVSLEPSPVSGYYYFNISYSDSGGAYSYQNANGNIINKIIPSLSTSARTSILTYQSSDEDIINTLNVALASISAKSLDRIQSVIPLSEIRTQNVSIMQAINFVRINDFSFSFTMESRVRLFSLGSPSFGVSFLNSNINSANGKFGSLNFNDPQWTTIIGNNNETEIWMDALLDGKVIAQGSAMLRKKLT